MIELLVEEINLYIIYLNYSSAWDRGRKTRWASQAWAMRDSIPYFLLLGGIVGGVAAVRALLAGFGDGAMGYDVFVELRQTVGLAVGSVLFFSFRGVLLTRCHYLSPPTLFYTEWAGSSVS